MITIMRAYKYSIVERDRIQKLEFQNPVSQNRPIKYHTTATNKRSFKKIGLGQEKIKKMH